MEVNSARGERTLMYMRPKGRNMEMVILAVEPNEAVALLTRLNPDSLARALDDPHGFAFGRK